MVLVLEQMIVQEIARIGRLRAPNEACGLLLPIPYRGRQVWEMPNRSMKPHDSFEMHGTDMLLALEGFFPAEPTAEWLSGITAWHTHPQGNVGPSRNDLQNKPAYIRSLVVSIPEKGPPLATWF
jgi:proteasome lid subunit RPN8/RPN11